MAGAGVVLAGGRSSRMGTAKAGLEWHGSTLLRRIVGILARASLGPLVVVRAPGQPLPPLPPGVEVLDDPVEGLGPLQGLATGLEAVAGRADRAFVAATDLPFLHPLFVCRVVGALVEDVDVALPDVGGHRHHLAAAYRPGVAARARALLDDGVRNVGALLERCAVRRLDVVELLDGGVAAADPRLASLVNLNDGAAYAAARARPAPRVLVRVGGSGSEQPMLAATLGAAARAAGVRLDECAAATVGGDHVPLDGEVPLVPGDAVAFEPPR